MYNVRELHHETPEVHVSGICLRSALGAQSKNILIGKRSPNRVLYPELWACCGGQLRYGETFAQGVERHYESDIGVKVEASELLLQSYHIRINKGAVIPGVRLICEWISGEPVLGTNTEFRWVDFNDLLAMGRDVFVPDLFDTLVVLSRCSL